MNKIILVGRLTRDPEIRTIGTGNSVANFTVAINRPFKNKEGIIEADFINVVSYRSVENIGKYCFKGSLIGIEGRLQTRSYDAQDGSKRYVSEVVADSVEFLGTKRDRNETQSGGFVDIPSATPIDTPSFEEGIDVSSEDPFKDFGTEVSLSDDDLPF